MLNNVIHRWLRVPYTLNVRHLHRPKKPVATLLFIHGIGNTGDAWNKVIGQMPQNVRIISIDLLGFGSSPSPSWAMYDAKTQARSVLATLLKLRITTPVIVIGHSLGALVAIEMSKRYPLLISRLILCSPPLFKMSNTKLPRADSLLRQFFIASAEHPQRSLRLAAFVTKYKLINESFNLTDANIESYMATLRGMIINQTSLDDAYNLKVPATIICGLLDPFIVAKNLHELAKKNQNVTVKTILAGHEVRGNYVRSLVKIIRDELTTLNKK